MRRLLLAIISLMFSALVSADDFCGLDSSIKRGKVLVTCSSCRAMIQYSIAGAAVASKAGLNEVLVENSRGSNQVHVTISTAYKNSSATISGGFASYQHPMPDPNNTWVTSFPVRGAPYGYAFAPQPVPKSTLNVACENLEEDAALEKIARDKAQALSGDNGVTKGMSYSEIQRLLNGTQTMAIPRPRTRVCTSGDGGCTESQ